MTDRTRLTRQALRQGRARVLLALALVGLLPLATLVLLEWARADHMATSLAIAAAHALLVMAAVTWFADAKLLRPFGLLVRHLAEDRPSDPADPQPRWMLQVDARMGEATTRMASDRAALDDSRAALDDARALQLQLTREVHHRVKNNLQVVASLLNLHRRGAASDDAAAAFRTIQNRVDALTSVHRHLVSSGDGADRVSARQLVEDIGSIFGDPDGLSDQPPIAASVPPDFSVSQDVALPVAFLLTELVELALHHNADALVRIAIVPTEETMAILTINSPIFADPACDAALTSGYIARVLAGLSRQLRSQLARSDDRTMFTLELAGPDQPLART